MQYSGIPSRGWWFGKWQSFQKPLSATVPNAVAPSMNVTTPGPMGSPGTSEVTFAVRVTGSPANAEVGPASTTAEGVAGAGRGDGVGVTVKSSVL